jgi:hypothetical protein
MDNKDAKPIGTRCARCDGQANVLSEEWTPERPVEESLWTCPRCQAKNAIRVAGEVVGVAIGTGHVISGRPLH